MGEDDPKSAGGLAPFGYRWENRRLSPCPDEAGVRKLIYELFIKHRRKSSVARFLNNLGYKTRRGSVFHDITVDRLIRDPTAKGAATIGGKPVVVEAIVSPGTWKRANDILKGARPPKQSVHLFGGLVYCECGRRMSPPARSENYLCPDCRNKITSDDLETVFQSQLPAYTDPTLSDIHATWSSITLKERRIVVEHLCERIVVGRTGIEFELISLDLVEGSSDAQDRMADAHESMFKTVAPTQGTSFGEGGHEPMLSEVQAAEFLGISKSTLLRQRYSGGIGHYRIGQRVLYSKDLHLIPFLNAGRQKGPKE